MTVGLRSTSRPSGRTSSRASRRSSAGARWPSPHRPSVTSRASSVVEPADRLKTAAAGAASFNAALSCRTLGLLDTRDDIARPRKHAPWSDQREQAPEGEPRVPGHAPQRRRPQTNVLVVRERQLTTVSVPQHAVGAALPDHDEASALDGTDYPPGG